MNSETIEQCNVCGSKKITSIDSEHNLCKCTECSFVFDSPRPTFSEIQNFYSQEDQYESWLNEESSRDALWERRLKKIALQQSSGSLLDIGTGIGQFLHHAKKHFTVAGTEVSTNAVSIAQSRYGLSLFKGKIEEYPETDTFDVVTAFHVLEHVPDPTEFLKKCHSLLNQNGTLIIAVPNELHSIFRQGARTLLKALKIGKFKLYGKHTLPKITLDGTLFEIHLSHFSKNTLAQLIEQNGFTIQENGLDPYYSASGILKLLHVTAFSVSKAILSLFGKNIYDTIWITAKKSSNL